MTTSLRPAVLVLALLVGAAGCSGAEQAAQPQTAQDSWITLFDGASLDAWTQAGPGDFVLEPDGSMRSRGGMGLFYYAEQSFRDYVLELDWKVGKHAANSGVFLRFPETTDPWVAVNEGYEIQIDNIRVKPLPETTPSAESLAELFAVEGEVEPIRVLMLTTTHGFRHGPAIEAAKEVMGALSETTEFQVDMTEDLAQLNPENLARYDLLFFANTTLRGGDGPAAAVEAPVEDVEMNGAFDNWRITMKAPQGDFLGKIELSGTAEAPTGAIKFDMLPAASELEYLVMEGQELTFSFSDEFMGRVQTKATIDGDALAGAFTIQGNDVAFIGIRPGGGPAPPPGGGSAMGSWRAYRLTLTTPQGALNGEAVLNGSPDDLSGTIQFDVSPAPSDLQDVLLDGDELTFHFDGGQYGRLDVQATLEGNEWDGTLTLGGGPMALTGTIQTADATPGNAAAEEEGPTVSEAQRDAIMGFIRSGKGIVGAHSALDAFYQWDEYREMVGGGLFDSHPWTQSVRVVIEEPDNPAVAHFGEGFWIRDEIYVLDENPRWNARVLASLDMESVGVEQGPADASRNDYPISWIRKHDGGRVFITKLGHFPDVWKTPAFLQHLLQGMRMAAGRLEANFSGHRVKEVIADNVWPDDIAIDERGNVWIAELRGKIHRYDAETGEVRQIAHLPTTDPTKIEHGLYGIEVDPNFYGGEPYIYLYYAERETIINTLSRFEYRNGEIDLSTEQVLLRVPTEPQCCHQAGDIERLFYNEWTPEMIPNYVPPLWEYTYETGGRSATVGPIYRHQGPGAFPEMFQNKIFLFDWSRRWIKYADVREVGFVNDSKEDRRNMPLQVSLPAKRFVNIKTFDQLTHTAPISMELGPDGSLYVAEFDGFWDAGPNAKVTRYRWVTDEF